MSIAIKTDFGELHGRDVIYCNKINQLFAPSKLIFDCDLNGRLIKKIDTEWLGIKFIFNNVLSYNCVALDYCSFENELVSSFDEVIDSKWAKEINTEFRLKHYRLATYDHVYEILADEAVLELKN